MKKIMSGLLVSGILLGFGAPTFAAELDVNKSGTTKLEITDYTVDPETGLPSDPGVFTLVEVPNIDFGKHSLDSIAVTNQTFTGAYDKDLKVNDTRPTKDSIDKALAAIDLVKVSDSVMQGQIDASKDKWTNAVAASAWKVNAQANDLTGNASSLKIGDTEVLTSAGTVVTETATAPVGTKSYELETPLLTINNNNLSIKTYEGTITYTAVNAL